MRRPSRRDALALAGAALLAPSIGGAAGTDAPPRIAALELDIAEAMLALGVAPVAMAEAARFRALFPGTPLPAACAELGASWEPNLERLQHIAPARILASSDRLMLVRQLRRIAPVTVIATQETDGRRQRGVELLRLIGRDLGRAADADAILASADARLAALRRRLAGRDLPPVFLVSLVDGGTHLEFYGAGCLLDDALRALGLRNACTLPMPAYGWSIAGIEHLADLPAAALLVLDFGAPTRRTLRRLETGALWRRLPPVAAGRMHLVRAASVWGGVPTLVTFAGEVTAALEAPGGDADGR
ncbi:ABC transporter substrate-binding protein [Ancylobacter sp. IITR112]|uniref:ABC transporter substrate-binding protein n=1 Tax=Ancylobacter sp. IITR112 TaxID=3138073 RepID=UPI00352B65F1